MKLLAAPLVLTLLAGLDPVSEELVFAPEKGTELTRTLFVTSKSLRRSCAS